MMATLAFNELSTPPKKQEMIDERWGKQNQKSTIIDFEQ